MKKVKALLLSVGVMTAVSALLLALLALIFSKRSSLPRSALPIVTTSVGSLAVFLGGFIASLYAKENGLLFGVFSGMIFAVCTALISAFLLQNSFNMGSAAKAAAILLSGSIGGILGVNRKSKVKF